MNTHTHGWTTMYIHGHPWALERAWAPMNSHEFVFFQMQCSWQITCWTICLTVFDLLILGFGYVSCWFNYSFLELNINFIFMFYFFCFVLWWLRAPKKILADFCKTWFVILIFLKLSISIYSYLFIQIYLYIYIYICICIYINIYLHICVYIYMCVCVNLCIYIYIYKSVCVGGVVSKWGVLFSSQRTLFGTKKTPRFETYPCIYNIFIFWHVFFCFYPVLVCPIQNIWFLFFFCM